MFDMLQNAELKNSRNAGSKKRCPPIDPGWGVDHIGGTLGGKVVVSTIEAAREFRSRIRSSDRSIHQICGLVGKYSRNHLSSTKRREKSGDIEEVPLSVVVEVRDWVL